MASKGGQGSEWDPHFEPLMNHLLKEGGIRIRSAVEIGRRAVDYCRAQDLTRWFQKNQSELREKFPACFAEKSDPLTPRDAEVLVEELCKLGFIYRGIPKRLVTAKPSSSNNGDNGASSTQPESQLKWPKRLEPSFDHKFGADNFYIIRYEMKSKWRYVYLSLLVSTVLILSLFPAWPLTLKLAGWYISFSMLSAILSLVVLRLFTFLALWFFGIDYWIFPNLFDENLGVVDSFKPFQSFVKRGDDWLMLGVRIFLAFLLAATTYQLSRTHTLTDVGRFATRQFLDVLDWGHQKLAAPSEASAPVLKYGGSKVSKVEEPLAEPSDPLDGLRCMQPCGFETKEALDDECIFDCACMTEVLTSPCFTKCPPGAKTYLEKGQREACEAEELDRGDEGGEDEEPAAATASEEGETTAEAKEEL